MKTNHLQPIIKSILNAADLFYLSHKNNQSIEDSFGYFTRNPIAAKLNQARLEKIIIEIDQQQKQSTKPLKVLDLACGGGIFTCAAGLVGCQSLGIDYNQAEIDIARQFSQIICPSAQFLIADLSQTQWQKQAETKLKGQPDIIILAYALHHLPNVENFISQLCQWAKPNTLFIINEENDQSLIRNLKQILRTIFIKNTDGETHRPIKEWQKLFTDNHAKISKITGLDYLPVATNHSWSIIFNARKLSH